MSSQQIVKLSIKLKNYINQAHNNKKLKQKKMPPNSTLLFGGNSN